MSVDEQIIWRRERNLDRLFLAMIHFDKGDAKRIQHFTKVHSYARLIGRKENLDEDSLFTLETAAYVHDIGIPVAEKKYGYQNGKLQEQEGPAAAQELLEKLQFHPSVIKRVCYLVGHHHTYDAIDGLDYQILVEADFLVNLFEDEASQDTILHVRDTIFRTKTGLQILNDMFGLEPTQAVLTYDKKGNLIVNKERIKIYKDMMQTFFRRAKVGGFVDWRHMGDLTNGIESLLRDASTELTAPEDAWNLFSLTGDVFLKWGKTEMDDDGDTSFVMSYVMDIWEQALKRLPGEKEQAQALQFFIKHLDGSVIDYMEEYLYEFMDHHFRTKALLQIKKKFLEEKLAKAEEDPKGYSNFHIDTLREYLLQIAADEGVPLLQIEERAAFWHSSSMDKRLLRIYQERGEEAKQVDLLEKMLSSSSKTWIAEYEKSDYEEQLKALYHKMGRTANYQALLKHMFYDRPGDEKLYEEYRSLFSRADWQKECDQHIFPVFIGKMYAMRLFEKEERYDLMMLTAEQNQRIEGYEEVLKERYPQRCLSILIKNANDTMAEAVDRRGYRKVGRILKKIKKYPEGPDKAAELAEKYCSENPRKTALRDEMNKIQKG